MSQNQSFSVLLLEEDGDDDNDDEEDDDEDEEDDDEDDEDDEAAEVVVCFEGVLPLLACAVGNCGLTKAGKATNLIPLLCPSSMSKWTNWTLKNSATLFSTRYLRA
mmetsp:Transcript_41287/g.80965  ORF Transcript_41287/g.80965 Transcript_41287/m.80965 type:complete len:106 (+) Transcript_41287:15-332(+)|eukprot:CAMPEP_0175175214 /NCGR_PEP_ID=MMETSP0087-20121206/33076_1 /TAXON_ID=136419 /ORGANISM="Unknown Unknown, Strain D1" /LENGTH=105 /DNA_ID=CAMNT_0016466795 /DNA_START=15 /DNA_END=332 /DNA_ORIENTATION=-